MSRSDRYTNVTFTLTALSVLVFLLAVTWAVISEQYARIHQSYSSYQQTAAQDRRNAANEIARACEGQEAVAFSNCIANRVESYYRQQTTNQDLQAQQDMAFWAKWMFIASTLTLGVTAFGIWLIYLNLREARRVTAEAEKHTIVALKTVGEAERQANIQEEAYRRLECPYLFVKVGSLDIESINRTGRPGLVYTLENNGKTSAVLRSIYVDFAPVKKFPLHIPVNTDELMYEVISPGKSLIEPRLVYISGSKPRDRWKGRQKTTLVFHGLVTYEDAKECSTTTVFAFGRMRAVAFTLRAAQHTITKSL